MSKVKFGSTVIQYTVLKTSRRKTSEIIVDKDNVIVRSPSSKTNEELKQIVKQKARWIFEKQQQFKNQKSAIVRPTFSEDTTVPYFGKNCILSVQLNQKKDSVKFSNSTLTVNLKGKWGNASNGTITLNTNLIKCSKDTIDYIIIHELCHLKIQDHSHKYWNSVRKHYPKYEEKIKELEILSRIII